MNLYNDSGSSPRKGIPAVASICIYIGLFLVFTSIAGAMIMMLGGGPSVGQRMALQAGTLLAAFVSACFMLRLLDHRPISDLGLSLKGRWADILWGMLVALAIYAIGFLTTWGVGMLEIVDFRWNASNLGVSFLFFVLVALAEEIMVRGYVLGRLLRTRLNKFVSLGISSLLFSLMHLLNPNVAFLPLFNIFLAGILLGASYLYTRNLWFPISLHLFWNWIQGPVLGYSVSGQQIADPLLITRMPVQNIVNGGSFGFEGSIICTALMVVFTGLILLFYSHHR